MAKRRTPRGLKPEERELWTRFARGIKPLDAERLKRLEREDIEPPKPSAPPIPQVEPLKSGALQRDLMREMAQRPARRTPVDRTPEKKVRRGQVEVEARLDLHGMTTASARHALLGFLHRCRDKGFRTVLVITGKGAGARALDDRRFQPWDPEERALPGILRRSFTQWMRDPDFAQLASGFAEASRKHGGSGAFYVMLRQR